MHLYYCRESLTQLLSSKAFISNIYRRFGNFFWKNTITSTISSGYRRSKRDSRNGYSRCTWIGGWNSVARKSLEPPGVLHLFNIPYKEVLAFNLADEDNSSTCFAVSTSIIMASVEAWNSTLRLYFMEEGESVIT